MANELRNEYLHLPSTVSPMTARERVLRIITIATFPLALILSLASGAVIKSHSRWGWRSHKPAVVWFGCIAAFISAASAMAILAANRLKDTDAYCDKPGRWQRCLTLVLDAIMAPGYLALLICVWVLDRSRVGYSGGSAMLLAYATVPLMINWLIHTYLISSRFLAATTRLVRALRASTHASFGSGTGCPNCQHCRHKQEMAAAGAAGAAGKSTNKEGYSLLRAEEYDEDQAESSTEPRISAEV